jgi:hypothetical protein
VVDGVSGLAEYNAAALRAEAWASWRERAACKGQGKLFDSLARKDQRAAQNTCTSCPVRVACLGWVMRLPEHDDPGGVCAGLTEADRVKARRILAPARQPAAVTLVAKLCRICKRLKQPAEFYRNADSPDGLRNECVSCYRGGKNKRGVA